MGRARVPFGNSAKRSSVWLAPADQGEVAVALGAKVLLASTAGFGLGSAGTIVRSRGLLQIRVNTTGADVSWDGAFGMAVVSDTARATGITAIPGPFSDSDWSGWYVHQFCAGELEFSMSVGRLILNWDYNIDSKAMRKVGGDEALVFVYESRLGAVDVVSHIRQLFKLA